MYKYFKTTNSLIYIYYYSLNCNTNVWTPLTSDGFSGSTEHALSTRVRRFRGLHDIEQWCTVEEIRASKGLAPWAHKYLNVVRRHKVEVKLP